MMAEYAQRVSKDITGKDNTPVYMSGHYNDVPIEDLEKHTIPAKVHFIGDFSRDDIYMDLFDGDIDKDELDNHRVMLLKLK